MFLVSLTSEPGNQLAKIARLYYLEGFNQKEIAEKQNVSVATVSRMLSQAKRERIVEINVHDERADFHSLEVRLERRFGLKECIILPTREKLANTYLEMAEVMNGVLARVLKPGAHFGVSWGETLKTVGENLASDLQLDVRVVPMIGAMGMIASGIYPNSIAKTFADKLGGVGYLVNAPAISGSAANRLALEQERHFAPVRELWNQIDTAIISVSGLTKPASVDRLGIFTPEELSDLQSRDVVCATNFNMLDSRGRDVANDLSERILNVRTPDLLRIPNLILVAAGTAKAQAVLSTLRRGIPNLLVIDLETAELVMRKANEDDN